MTIIQSLIKELNQEAETTRKMLSRLPEDKYDWKPHEKSMSVRHLAGHLAELPGWVDMTLRTSELDFAANPYVVPPINNNEELLAFFEKNLGAARSALEKATEKDLEDNWTLRNGAQVYSVRSKADVLRMSYCQTVHHRAQMGVYLRLLNVPIPGSYGPSADEMNF